MAVVDGRTEQSKKWGVGAEDVRAYIAAEIRKLFATREFLDALPGYYSFLAEKCAERPAAVKGARSSGRSEPLTTRTGLQEFRLQPS